MLVTALESGSGIGKPFRCASPGFRCIASRIGGDGVFAGLENGGQHAAGTGCGAGRSLQCLPAGGELRIHAAGIAAPVEVLLGILERGQRLPIGTRGEGVDKRGTRRFQRSALLAEQRILRGLRHRRRNQQQERRDHRGK